MSYTVSGIVLARTGSPLSGVLVDAGGGATATTAADGSYSIASLTGTHTLTPSKTGYTFLPAIRSVTGASAVQAFVAAAVAVSPAASVPYVFTWDDGVQTAYSSAVWAPNVTGPQEKRETLVATLNLGVTKVTQVTGAGGQIAPRRYALEWEWLGDTTVDVIAMIEATWQAGRAVTASFPYRGAMVTVTGYYVTAFEDVPKGGDVWGMKATLQEVR